MSNIEVIEVGLRDGLQNEKIILPIGDRAELARKLIAAGVRRLELGAFVRPDRVPQMAGSAELVNLVAPGAKDVQFSVLVPNVEGMKKAMALPVQEIALFTAASETFCQKNINCTVEESLTRFKEVIALIKSEKKKFKIRGYVSTCFGCPFEGWIEPKKVAKLVEKMLDLGCHEISIGDTIGVAEPRHVKKLFQLLRSKTTPAKLAGHFHNTRGLALINMMTAFELGIRRFDSSIGGLGGCPFAPGAAGNVATEDVVYMFEGAGVKTGLNLEALIAINRWLAPKMERKLNSSVASVGLKFA